MSEFGFYNGRLKRVPWVQITSVVENDIIDPL